MRASTSSHVQGSSSLAHQGDRSAPFSCDIAICPSLNPSGSQRKAPKRHDPNVPVLCDTLVFCSAELSRMGPVQVIQQVVGGMLAMCLRLGRMALSPEVRKLVIQFCYCLGLHQEPPQKKKAPTVTGGCSQKTPLQDLNMAEWVHQQSETRKCTPQAGALMIRVPVPERWALGFPGKLNPH